MFGWIRYHGPEREEPPLQRVEGATLRTVCVPAGETLRARLACDAAARRLRREGVREAVFPEGFAYRERFARRGVLPVPVPPLYRASAAAIVRCVLRQKGIDPRSAELAFCAEGVTAELRALVYALAAEARYVALSVPRGGEALSRALMRDCGAAARLLAPGEPVRAALTVDFDGASGRAGALRLDDTLRVDYEGALPCGLLAALWRSGALDAGTLRVERVRQSAENGQTSCISPDRSL